MLHRPGLDPLECRLAARERDQLTLHPEDVVDLVERAAHLDRIGVEADDVGAREEAGVDVSAVGSGRGAGREVVGQSQERDLAVLLRRREFLGIPDRDVGLVRKMPADASRAADPRRRRVDGGHRASGEPGQLLLFVVAADAEEEVDAGGDARRVVGGALAPDHAREDRSAVDAERRRGLDSRSSGRDRARRRGSRRHARRKLGWEHERGVRGGRSVCGSGRRGRVDRVRPGIGSERAARLGAHAVPPPGQHAIAVCGRGLEPVQRGLARLSLSDRGRRRPDSVSLVQAELDHDAPRLRNLPPDDRREGADLLRDDLGNGHARGVCTRGRERGGRHEGKQE